MAHSLLIAAVVLATACSSERGLESTKLGATGLTLDVPSGWTVKPASATSFEINGTVGNTRFQMPAVHIGQPAALDAALHDQCGATSTDVVTEKLSSGGEYVACVKHFDNAPPSSPGRKTFRVTLPLDAGNVAICYFDNDDPAGLAAFTRICKTLRRSS